MDEQKLVELKPCPFCGSEPRKWFWLEDEKWAYASIQCKKCNVEMKKRESFSCVSATNPGNAFIKVGQNVVEAWNMRTDKDIKMVVR